MGRRHLAGDEALLLGPARPAQEEGHPRHRLHEEAHHREAQRRRLRGRDHFAQGLTLLSARQDEDAGKHSKQSDPSYDRMLLYEASFEPL